MGALTAGWSPETVGIDAATGPLVLVGMAAMFAVGIGWYISGFTDIGLILFCSRVGTFFFGGFVTYMFHGATTESMWLDLVNILALTPAAIHILIIPPVSAAVLAHRLKARTAATRSA
jgi:hypothetical protein